jgi:dTDP-4-dehydrorhamnose reductase
MKSKLVLLTGASGYLGRHLEAALLRAGFRVVCTGRRDAALRLELDDPRSILDAVRCARPDRIVNAAALSSMAACAQSVELARQCNHRAVEVLASTIVPLIQVSTDLVFDGAHAPYGSDAAPRPLSVYGLTKFGGERAALAERGTVVRLPLLFGPSFDGRRGATDMLRSAVRERRPLRLFADEYRTPIHVRDAAEAIASLVDDPDCGVLHVAGPDRISRSELARRLADLHGLDASAWQAVPADDPTRPRDVSMLGDLPVKRSLEEMLRES